MAGNTQRKTADRHIVHCLRCYKPQEKLSVHLTRACMKHCPPEERAAELRKAKDSVKKWASGNRTWDYSELCMLLPHKPSRIALVNELLRRGFFIKNKPHDSEMAVYTGYNAATTSAATPATATSTAHSPTSPDNNSSSSSDPGEGQSDPSWQRATPAVTTHMRVKVEDAGLHQKFPNQAKLLTDFKKYLRESLMVSNYQQEFDNVSRFLRYMQPRGDEPTLDFLTKSIETRDYLESLKKTGMTAATLLNHFKNIFRFLDYLRTRLDLEQQDPRLQLKITAYEEMLQTLQKPVSKVHLREVYKPRMIDYKTVVATAILLESLADSSPESSDQTSLTAPSSIREDQTPADFSSFSSAFPVTMHGQPPSKKARVDAGFPSDRVFYDKWRTCQFKQRQEFLLSNFTHRKPSAGKVARLIEKKGWKANHPKPEDITKLWCPAPKQAIETDKAIVKSVSTQRWKGLAIKDFDDGKGLGVVATRPFSKGDIVCDYHGRLVSAAEGRKMMQEMTGDEAGHLFFFKDLCIDAQTFPCDCHPDMDTIGRRINHSSKRPNLKPLHCILRVEGEDRDVILFRALSDIRVDAKLKFDYGKNRKSSRGEGLDLEWLDE